ncbi:FxsA family protein [Lignipirellula cremea]|uniref:Phage T7 F exclusion suppressor FxsA n=1 Tax=Lignipirellula cremea TaxID=2528010 RepID=A0A518DLM1_9BACT|nr:FxsA family protein [Lignipirellula cremea]QDU92736.1 phage T7 F exclusion suppressor FxsA [Lignipirellula cremea]
MLYKLFLLFIIVPMVEMALLFWIASHTRWYVSLAVVIVSGMVGAALAKHQGFRVFRRIREEMQQGQMPGDALLDAFLILCASLLLLTPGVLTDAVGMLLLIPPARHWVKPRLVQWFKTRFRIGGARGSGAASPTSGNPSAGRSQVIDSYVVDSKVEKPDGK